MTTILETERLVLRQWRAEDAEPLFAFAGDAETMRFIGSGQPWPDIETAHRWLGRVTAAYRERGYGIWAVIEKANGRLIGSCGFSLLPDSGEIDFGYVYARDTWGRGLATEAARAVLRYAFEQLGFAEVTANTAPEHHASRRVLEKVGFVYQGLRRYPGDDEDSAFYVARRPMSDQLTSRAD